MTDLDRLRAAHLAETEWLAEHLNDPQVRVVDVRGEVRSQTDATGYQTSEYLGQREAYLQGHIPGAVYLDWTTDLIDEADPVPAQVAPPEKIARVLGKAGIGSETVVVAYDDHPASQFATRLWWVLCYYGHTECRVLNGGWSKWQSEGQPVSTEVPQPPPVQFTPSVQPEWRRTAEQVAASLNEQGRVLVDARDEGQYTARIRRGIRGGHVPGALNCPREALLRPDRTWETPERLAEVLETTGIPSNAEVTAYCNGGVASTTVLFALSMLGRSHLSNYDGSWNEWNQRLDLPVEP